MDVLSDAIVSATLHELLSVIHQPIDNLMVRLVQLGFQPITQGSAFIYAISLFVVRYVHHMDEGIEQKISIKLAQADVISHPAISRFIGNQVGEAIDNKVKK